MDWLTKLWFKFTKSKLTKIIDVELYEIDNFYRLRIEVPVNFSVKKFNREGSPLYKELAEYLAEDADKFYHDHLMGHGGFHISNVYEERIVKPQRTPLSLEELYWEDLKRHKKGEKR